MCERQTRGCCRCGQERRDPDFISVWQYVFISPEFGSGIVQQQILKFGGGEFVEQIVQLGSGEFIKQGFQLGNFFQQVIQFCGIEQIVQFGGEQYANYW